MNRIGNLVHDTGTNQPKTLKDEVEQRHPDIFGRYAELVKTALSVPVKIQDDETAGKVGDLLTALRLWRSKADATRKAETEEYRQKTKTVNNLFNGVIEIVEKLEAQIKDRNETYLQEKLAKAQAELEARAAREREDSEKRQREAAEAEARRVAAEREAREAEERAAAARRQREEDERKAGEARAEAARLKAERERLDREALERDDAERRAREADLHQIELLLDRIVNLDDLKESSSTSAERLDQLIATSGEVEVLLLRMEASERLLPTTTKRRVAAIKERLAAARSSRADQLQREKDARIQAEQERLASEKKKRDEDDAAAARAREAQSGQERLAREASNRAKVAKADEREATRDARDATKEAGAAGREYQTSMGAALRHEARADKADAKAEGHAGDLVRTRGDLGSVSTLARVWEYRIVDRKAVFGGHAAKATMDTLWPYLSEDDIQRAIQKYLDGGGRYCPGVVIEQIERGRTV